MKLRLTGYPVAVGPVISHYTQFRSQITSQQRLQTNSMLASYNFQQMFGNQSRFILLSVYLHNVSTYFSFTSLEISSVVASSVVTSSRDCRDTQCNGVELIPLTYASLMKIKHACDIWSTVIERYIANN